MVAAMAPARGALRLSLAVVAVMAPARGACTNDLDKVVAAITPARCALRLALAVVAAMAPAPAPAPAPVRGALVPRRGRGDGTGARACSDVFGTVVAAITPARTT